MIRNPPGQCAGGFLVTAENVEVSQILQLDPLTKALIYRNGRLPQKSG